MKREILIGDCFELIKNLPDNSVDLVITSPPYSDIVNYGKQVSTQKPDDYVDWLLPLFVEIYRVLKPSGSFILNINDKCEKGYRSTYIYDLISRNNKETRLKLYDTYIWHKKNGIPNGGTKRFRNTTEFIFHFAKDNKHIKFNMDRVLQDKVRPDNVFRFSTAGAARDNLIKHPAPYHKELPLYFVNLLTDEGDLVLDPLSGIATTGMACKDLNRNYIGYELNEIYAEYSVKRLDDSIGDRYIVNQYSFSNKLLNSFTSAAAAAAKLGLRADDIMRCYSRNGYNSCGGFIFKLEKEN